MAQSGQNSGDGLPFVGQVPVTRPKDPASLKHPERPGAVALVRCQISQQAGPQRRAEILAVRAQGVGHPQGQGRPVQMFDLFQLLQCNQRIVDHLLDPRGHKYVLDLVAELNDRHGVLEGYGTGEHGSRN